MDQQLSRIRSNHSLILALPAGHRSRVFGASKHKFVLNPVATSAQVEQMEEVYGFAVPEGYRRFILEIGDGGAGPCYGLKKRFVTFGSSLREAEAVTYRFPSVYVSDEPVPEDEEDDDQHVRGNMSIFEVGCGSEGVLILNGPMRGKVCVTDYGFTPHHFWSPPDFLDAYESWQTMVLFQRERGLSVF